MAGSQRAAQSEAQPISTPPAENPNAKPQLRRILGMRDLVLLIIGTVISAGRRFARSCRPMRASFSTSITSVSHSFAPEPGNCDTRLDMRPNRYIPQACCQ